MDRDKPFLKSSFIAILLIYLVSGIFLQKYYQYEGLNANTIGYITVALEYARGNFGNAVNGFWPPLISWLIVPFIKLDVTPLLAGRIVMLITGLFLLIGANELSYRFEISENIRTTILFSLIPITLSYTIIVFPDLLILCILVFYLSIVFDSGYPDSKYSGALSGVLGAFAYFSKHYALPFFITHFLLFNILHYLRGITKEQKKNVLWNAFIGMVLFSILSGLWVMLMSNKYNYLTIGTAGKYNLAKLSPDLKAIPGFYEREAGDPPYYVGLLKPSYETALSAWDDPTYVSEKYFGKSRFPRDPKYLIKLILKNIFRIKYIFITYFSVLSIPILIAYVLFCVQPVNKFILRGSLFYPLATMALYSAGYMLTVIYHDTIRYLWLDNILLLLMGGQVLSVLFRNEFFNSGSKRNILILFFVLSFIILPFKDITQKPDRGDKIYALFKELDNRYHIKGNIASNDNWGYTLELVYYLNLNKKPLDKRTYYYGMPKKNQNDERLLKELKSYNIDYYIIWGESNFLPGYKDITEGRLPDLKIFSLKK